MFAACPAKGQRFDGWKDLAGGRRCWQSKAGLRRAMRAVRSVGGSGPRTGGRLRWGDRLSVHVALARLLQAFAFQVVLAVRWFAEVSRSRVIETRTAGLVD